VELIGPNQPLEHVARDAGAIPYEILTSLRHRYDRGIISDPNKADAEENMKMGTDMKILCPAAAL